MAKVLEHLLEVDLDLIKCFDRIFPVRSSVVISIRQIFEYYFGGWARPSDTVSAVAIVADF